MSDDSQRWKEKYLHSIDQQEKLERRWDARLDLLRRGLVRSTLAAEGSDRAVDACMKEMREVVRSDDMDARLAALIPRLETAVLESEQRRQARVEQIGSALGALVAQLQALPLPRDIRKPLKKLAHGLDKRAGQAREMPLLLSELSGLQEQALGTLDRPLRAQRAGLLKRLFGSPEAVVPAGTQVSPAVSEVAADSAPAHQAAHPIPVPDPALADVVPEPMPASAPASEAEIVASKPEDEPGVAMPLADSEPLAALVQGLDTPDDVQADEQGLYALPANLEPPYSSVATHIETTLLNLLGELTLPERYMAQARPCTSVSSAG